MLYYTAYQLGPKRSVTPEGFLLVKDVPIARTGVQLYHMSELPGIDPGPDGTIRVQRLPEDVFRPATMASFEGKSICDDHPDEDVTVDNWRELECGHMQNVHRGVGTEDDFLFADFIIKDRATIAAVDDGKREVSCGYDADYEQLEPGLARQHNIIGNHVALVDQGRCGPRCAIGDEAMPQKVKVWDRIRQAFKARDEEALNKALNEVKDEIEPGQTMDDIAETGGGSGGGDTHVHLHMAGDKPQAEDAADPVDKTDQGGSGEQTPKWFSDYASAQDTRMGTLEAAVAKLIGTDGTEEEGEEGDTDAELEEDDPEPDATGDEEPEETMDEDLTGEDPNPKATGDRKKNKDRKFRNRDSSHLVNTFQETMARAEILSPGVRLLKYNRTLDAKKTLDGLCGFRRRVLSAAYTNDDAREVIDSIRGSKRRVTFTDQSMTCDAVKAIYNGASELMKSRNNGGSVITTAHSRDNGSVKVPSIADVNKRNADFYKGSH